MRAVAKAAANAIATAAATAVAVAMATARDGCVGGLAVAATGGNKDDLGRRTTTAQHTPLPGCKVFVLSTHFRPNQEHTASHKMCRANLSSWNTCGRGIGDATGHASNAHGFSVSLFVDLFGRAHADACNFFPFFYFDVCRFCTGKRCFGYSSLIGDASFRRSFGS